MRRLAEVLSSAVRWTRLAASVALEGLVNAGHVIVFPWRRRRERERVRAAMCRRATAVLLLCVLAGAVSGCASTQFPGSSFGHQVEELRWTTVRLLEQPRWHQELWHDIRILADPEPGELASTFEMLGW